MKMRMKLATFTSNPVHPEYLEGDDDEGYFFIKRGYRQDSNGSVVKYEEKRALTMEETLDIVKDQAEYRQSVGVPVWPANGIYED